MMGITEDGDQADGQTSRLRVSSFRSGRAIPGRSGRAFTGRSGRAFRDGRAAWGKRPVTVTVAIGQCADPHPSW